MFQALKDWWEQRAALRDLRQADTLHGGGYSKFVEEEVARARAAFDCADRKLALLIITKARAVDPVAAMLSREWLRLLLDLGSFEMAEGVMKEALRRYPGHPYTAIGYAQVAYRRGDLEEALRRCEFVRRKFAHLADGYTIAMQCLSDLGREPDAEAMIARAVRKLPTDFEVMRTYASYATRRRDWPEALKRWDVFSQRFDHFLGPVSMAQVLREMGRYDEAEKIARDACERFPKDTWPFVELTATLAIKGDLEGAANEWDLIRKEFPYFILARTAGAQAALRAGRAAQADQILSLAVEQFRSSLEVHLEYARIAHGRSDWAAAVERWALVLDRFPDCAEARRQEAQALAALRQQEAVEQATPGESSPS